MTDKLETQETDIKITFYFDVIKRYDQYIASVNFKAAFLMSFIVAINASYLPFISKLTKNSNELNGVIVTLSLLIVLFSILAAFDLYRAVFPRMPSSKGYSSTIYSKDVASYSGPSEFYRKVLNFTEEEMLKDITEQTFALSQVFEVKMKFIKNAINTLTILIFPLLLLLIAWAIFVLS